MKRATARDLKKRKIDIFCSAKRRNLTYSLACWGEEERWKCSLPRGTGRMGRQTTGEKEVKC